MNTQHNLDDTYIRPSSADPMQAIMRDWQSNEYQLVAAKAIRPNSKTGMFSTSQVKRLLGAGFTVQTYELASGRFAHCLAA